MTSSSTSSEDVGDRADALGSAITSHTPGPWAAILTIPSSGWGEPDVWQIEAHGHAVCTSQDCFATGTEANARLIAAAPDLLEALKALQEYAVKHVPVGEGHHHPVWTKTANAIAKAEGRSPSSSIKGDK
jgi:hypothetical protein